MEATAAPLVPRAAPGGHEREWPRRATRARGGTRRCPRVPVLPYPPLPGSPGLVEATTRATGGGDGAAGPPGAIRSACSLQSWKWNGTPEGHGRGTPTQELSVRTVPGPAVRLSRRLALAAYVPPLAPGSRSISCARQGWTFLLGDRHEVPDAPTTVRDPVW